MQIEEGKAERKTRKLKSFPDQRASNKDIQFSITSVFENHQFRM